MRARARARSSPRDDTKEPSNADLLRQIELLTTLYQQSRHGPTPTTLNEYLPRWRARVFPQLAESTSVSYDSVIRRMIAPQLGAALLEHIDDVAIVAWQEALRNMGYSVSTIAAAVKLLKTILRNAVKDKHLVAMPEVVINHEQKEQPWLTADEYQLVVDTAEQMGGRMLALVLIGGDAGLRRGEAIGLRFSHVVDGVIYLSEQRGQYGTGPLKNKRTRIVPMTGRLAALIARLRAEAASENSYVLLNSRGEPLSYHSVMDRMRAVLKRAGIKKRVTYHSERHTFISHLAGKGAPLPVVQKLVGHADMSTTQRYMHTEEDQLHDAIEALRR